MCSQVRHGSGWHRWDRDAHCNAPGRLLALTRRSAKRPHDGTCVGLEGGGHTLVVNAASAYMLVTKLSSTTTLTWSARNCVASRASVERRAATSSCPMLQCQCSI